MVWDVVLILSGFILLMLAADRLVYGASGLARNLGMPPMLIGLTIVAMGTSAPEIVVSIVAALNGHAEIALGNAIGSNIANIGLVVGVTALLAPMTVRSKVLRKEFPILFLIMLLTGLLMVDGKLQRVDGVLLLLGLLIMLIWLVATGRKPDHDPLSEEFAEEIPEDESTATAIVWVTVGLIALPLVSKFCIIDPAVRIAQIYGLSDIFIGLTIIAIGTSLPEVATSIMGAAKGEYDIAIGNVLGSNMFNLLAVLSLPAIISPFSLEHIVLKRDLPIMVGITILLFVMSFGYRREGIVNRLEGLVLLLIYIAYLGWLCYSV